MIGHKIWGTSQLLNALILVIAYQIIGAVVAAFAVLGGIPALLVFVIWVDIARCINMPGWLSLILTLVIFPLATAICAFGMRHLMGDHSNELLMFCIIPICTTVVSVLIYSKRIMALPKIAENHDYYTEA